jgi:hypothetical protein
MAALFVLVSSVIALVVAVTPLAGVAQMGGSGAALPPCHFQLGFATLQALIPAAVGDCLDDEAYSANGDSLQHTSNGLLVWRKSDNFTAFTDGYYTWVNGPTGLQVRLNNTRFVWEANPAGLPVVASGITGIEGLVTLGPTTPVCRVGVPCSRPISAPIAITDAAGRAIITVISGADGHFRMDLPPGVYTLTPLPLQSGSVYPHPVPTTAAVTAGVYTSVAVTYDTGLR